MRPWVAQPPAQFTDRRSQWKADHVVTLHVRSYRGVAGRINDETWRAEYQRCGHAHNKMSTARKCGEALARRLNRLDKKGTT